jgi:hypothetical protein
VQVYFDGTFSSNRYGSMVEFMGTEATLYVDRGRYEVIPDRDKKKPQPSSLILGTDQRRALDFYDKPDGELLHIANWAECILDRSKTPPPPPNPASRRHRRPPDEPVGAERAGGGVEGLMD